jgi:hypothetical protein
MCITICAKHGRKVRKTEGQRLILADGTTLENCVAGYAEGFLWLYLTGYTIQQAAALFFDPAKTAHIVFQYGDMKDEYTGFTDCRTLTTNTDGQVSVCMARGE